MTDIIADTLNRIHTSSARRTRSISLPARKMTEAIIAVLVSEGFVASYAKKGKKANKHIDVELRYISRPTRSEREEEIPALNGFRRLSKPSRRLYVGASDIPFVKGGYGVSVLSTPQGILTGKDAKAKGVGGELLFEVW